jgi:undecaprenyl diphosphate synthase
MKTPNNLNSHANILLIPDGNRRWAKKRGLTYVEGYTQMAKKIALFADLLKSQGFDHFYLANNSFKHLDRPNIEIETYYQAYLNVPKYSKNRLKVTLAGNLSLIPTDFIGKYKKMTQKHLNSHDFTIHYLMNWSTPDEVVRIYNRLHKTHKTIDESILRSNADIKDRLDLIIRTGKVRHMSFMPLFSEYTKIYFLDILFPDLTKKDVDKVLNSLAP